MLELLIVILIPLWLFGYIGHGRWYFRRAPDITTAAPPFGRDWLHFLLIIVLIPVIVRLLT